MLRNVPEYVLTFRRSSGFPTCMHFRSVTGEDIIYSRDAGQESAFIGAIFRLFCHQWHLKKILKAFGEETQYKETADVQLSGGAHPDYIGSKCQTCPFITCYYILLRLCRQIKTSL